ncbi:hypothetical protein [Halomonas sp. BM-2019]|uniref:hypothetical protein n=1 Tax=Halomonas sp. BM-2019 TaxID=2811227 RepID=UPI001B3C4981|nr:MAG: hypothetical protein J5F18_14945 [Halomonas sp. BM-2019]
MVKRPWKPALLAALMALGLAGCGNGDEADPAAEEPPAEPAAVEESAEPAEPLDDELSPEEQAGLVDDEADEAEAPAAEVPDPDEVPEEIPEADTLGESPATTLDEGAALPGETTADDIDAMLEETERRFEEAQRRIEEQFEEAEGEAAVPEPLEDDDAFDAGMDFDTGLEDEALDTGGPTSSEIDAIIEEQERRFEEAQRRLQEQFDEVEQELPEFEPMEAGEDIQFEPME